MICIDFIFAGIVNVQLKIKLIHIVDFKTMKRSAKVNYFRLLRRSPVLCDKAPVINEVRYVEYIQPTWQSR
jgi:hypothetical protein